MSNRDHAVIQTLSRRSICVNMNQLQESLHVLMMSAQVDEYKYLSVKKSDVHKMMPTRSLRGLKRNRLSHYGNVLWWNMFPAPYVFPSPLRLEGFTNDCWLWLTIFFKGTLYYIETFAAWSCKVIRNCFSLVPASSNVNEGSCQTVLLWRKRERRGSGLWTWG